MIGNSDVVQATDDAIVKLRKIGNKWAILFAADNANMFIPICRKAEMKLSQHGTNLSFPTAQKVVCDAYKEMFDEEFTAKFLSRYGFKNIADFRALGLQQFGENQFTNICDAINRFDLGITLLVCGFDGREPRIFEVSNPGSITDHSLLQYAVVGSGSYMALAALRRKSLNFNLEDTIYRLLDAKFSAETAAGVGKITSLITMNVDGEFGFVMSEMIGKIRKIRDNILHAPEPKSAIELIEMTTAVKNMRNSQS